MLSSLVHRAFPMLDYYLALGAAVHNITRLGLNREDIQVVIYLGQIRVGYADEPHVALDIRVGTLWTEPTPEEWQQAADVLNRTLPVRPGAPVRSRVLV